MTNFTALVVEDDVFQRIGLVDLFKSEGMEVVECSTAEAAELVVVSAGTELLALVTDNSLAGEMKGVELAGYAKRKFPHIRVVLVSGSQPEYVPHDITFLSKPYTAEDILKVIRG